MGQVIGRLSEITPKVLSKRSSRRLSQTVKKKKPRVGAFIKHSFYKVILAGAQGLEPGTYGFGDRRSTN